MTNSDLWTVWTQIGKMYNHWMLGFNQKLLLEARCHGAFDNHNKKKIKKTITDGNTAFNHIGTSTFLKEDVPYELPKGTVVASPCRIPFVVLSCIEHSVSRYKVVGALIPTALLDIDEAIIVHERN